MGQGEISEFDVMPPTTKASLERNALEMTGIFELHKSGYFGKKSNHRVRVIEVDQVVTDSTLFFERLSKGAIISQRKNAQGKIVTLAYFDNGDHLAYRLITSTKGSPAVEITVVEKSLVRSQKIHFILNKEKNND